MKRYTQKRWQQARYYVGTACQFLVYLSLLSFRRGVEYFISVQICCLYSFYPILSYSWNRLYDIPNSKNKSSQGTTTVRKAKAEIDLPREWNLYVNVYECVGMYVCFVGKCEIRGGNIFGGEYDGT